jgi:hypothetical protein
VGEWRKSSELCDRAYEQLETRCKGVVWDLNTAQAFSLSSLVYLGEIREMSRRMPAMIAAAEAKGNLSALTQLKTRLNVVSLAAADPAKARRDVRDTMSRWSQEGFHRQHFNALRARVQIELYAGDGESAYRHMTEVWPALKDSLLMRVQVLRVEAHYLRACAALALAATTGERGALLRDARRSACRIERERMAWCRPLASLANAGIAALDGDRARAIDGYRRAAELLDASDMRLYAAAARRRLGELQGGETGARLVAEAESRMARQEIRDPAKMMRVMVPTGCRPR